MINGFRVAPFSPFPWKHFPKEKRKKKKALFGIAVNKTKRKRNKSVETKSRLTWKSWCRIKR